MHRKDLKRRVAWCDVCFKPVRANHADRCPGYRNNARRLGWHLKEAAKGYAPALAAAGLYILALIGIGLLRGTI